MAALILVRPLICDSIESTPLRSRSRTAAVGSTHSKVPLAQANALLGTSYRLYCHAETNVHILGTIGYALPTALREHIEAIVPTTYFSSSHALWQTLPGAERPYAFQRH